MFVFSIFLGIVGEYFKTLICHCVGYLFRSFAKCILACLLLSCFFDFNYLTLQDVICLSSFLSKRSDQCNKLFYFPNNQAFSNILTIKGNIHTFISFISCSIFNCTLFSDQHPDWLFYWYAFVAQYTISFFPFQPFFRSSVNNVLVYVYVISFYYP